MSTTRQTERFICQNIRADQKVRTIYGVAASTLTQLNRIWSVQQFLGHVVALVSRLTQTASLLGFSDTDPVNERGSIVSDCKSYLFAIAHRGVLCCRDALL
jgi:hypothetical protein